MSYSIVTPYPSMTAQMIRITPAHAKTEKKIENPWMLPN
jgi:hypothetical protein